MALKIARCESIETIIRKRQLFFTGGVARHTMERLASGVLLGTMDGG